MRRQRPQRVRVLVVDGHTPSTDRLKEMVAANFEVVARCAKVVKRLCYGLSH
jgi:hypothetical protein